MLNNIHSKKKDQVIPLISNNAVKVKGDVINIDPQLLFQRLVTAGTRNDSLAEIYEYELCSYPPQWRLMPPDLPTPSGEIQYVLDGGALPHRDIWKQGSTYANLCQAYTRYVAAHYGRAIVVFDG